MIDYFLLTSYPRKIVLILHLSLFLYTFLLFVLFIELGSTYDRILYQMTFYFHQKAIIMPIYVYLLWFILLILTIDHDERYHALIYPYFNRMKVDVLKLFSYIITYTYLFIIMTFITETFFYLFLNLSMSSTKLWLFTYLDGLICMLIYLSLIKNKQKSIYLILPLNLVMIHFVVSDQKSVVFYYLFPIFHEFFDNFLLAMIYKVWYICLWFLLYLISSTKRKIPA